MQMNPTFYSRGVFPSIFNVNVIDFGYLKSQKKDFINDLLLGKISRDDLLKYLKTKSSNSCGLSSRCHEQFTNIHNISTKLTDDGKFFDKGINQERQKYSQSKETPDVQLYNKQRTTYELRGENQATEILVNNLQTGDCKTVKSSFTGVFIGTLTDDDAGKNDEVYFIPVKNGSRRDCGESKSLLEDMYQQIYDRKQIISCKLDAFTENTTLSSNFSSLKLNEKPNFSNIKPGTVRRMRKRFRRLQHAEKKREKRQGLTEMEITSSTDIENLEDYKVKCRLYRRRNRKKVSKSHSEPKMIVASKSGNGKTSGEKEKLTQSERKNKTKTQNDQKINSSTNQSKKQSSRQNDKFSDASESSKEFNKNGYWNSMLKDHNKESSLSTSSSDSDTSLQSSIIEELKIDQKIKSSSEAEVSVKQVALETSSHRLTKKQVHSTNEKASSTNLKSDSKPIPAPRKSLKQKELRYRCKCNRFQVERTSSCETTSTECTMLWRTIRNNLNPPFSRLRAQTKTHDEDEAVNGSTSTQLANAEQETSNNRTSNIISKHSKDTMLKPPENATLKYREDTILNQQGETKPLKRSDNSKCVHNSCPSLRNHSNTLLKSLQATSLSAPRVNSEIEEVIHEVRNISEENSINHVVAGEDALEDTISIDESEISFSELQTELKKLNEIRFRTVKTDYKMSSISSSPSLTEISKNYFDKFQNMEKVYPIFTPKSKQNNENIEEDEQKSQSNHKIPEMSMRCYKIDSKSTPIVAKNQAQSSRKFEECEEMFKVHEIYQESKGLRTISNFSISSSASLSPNEATINEAKKCPKNLQRREICLQDIITKLF